MRGAGAEQEVDEQVEVLSDFPPPINAQRGEVARAGSKQLILRPGSAVSPTSSSAGRRRKLAAADLVGNLPLCMEGNFRCQHIESFKHIVSYVCSFATCIEYRLISNSYVLIDKFQG